MTNYNQNSSQEVAEKKYKLLRFSGNKSFFEIMTYAFNINKVAFQLTNYDTNNSSKNVVITCFLTFDEILAMCHDILSGRFVQEIQAMQNNAQASGKNFFGKQIHIGGGNDKNGRLISRTLSVSMAKMSAMSCLLLLFKMERRLLLAVFHQPIRIKSLHLTSCLFLN